MKKKLEEESKSLMDTSILINIWMDNLGKLLKSNIPCSIYGVGFYCANVAEVLNHIHTQQDTLGAAKNKLLV